MLHHVALEIAPADVDASVGFFELLGFSTVDSPDPLGGHVSWLERDGTQIHLIHTDGASAPHLGHAALVVDDFDRALREVAAAGHEVAETRQLWGARRAFAISPGGHRVELMAAPPPRSV